MKEAVYLCKFTMNGEDRFVETNPKHLALNCGISTFKEGFWLNAVYELTCGSDAMYWIPPAAIKYIYKDNRGF